MGAGVTGFWGAAGELEAASTPFVVVTLVGLRGHAPQDPGAKAIVTTGGLCWGTVGGGKVEAKAIELSRELLGDASRSREPKLVTWNLQRDIGMSCGGEVTYLFEVHRNDSWRVAVFGAGHVAQALVRLLSGLDCQVTCVDPRSEWIERIPASPRVTAVLEQDPPAYVERLDAGSFFIIMTRGHATDVPVAEAVLRRFPETPYVGVLGSDVKAIKVRAELKERGIPEERVARLRCPMGLPLGSNRPNEIAISIVAELLQVRDSLRKA